MKIGSRSSKAIIAYLCICFGMLIVPANAQWTTSGGNIYSNNDGNVGIGTSAPAEKLHLNGGKFVITSDNGAYGQLQINSSNINTEATLVFGSGGSAVNYGTYSYTGAIGLGAYTNTKDTLVLGTGVSDGTMFLRNGSVGIGTASPGYRLDVNGTANFSNNIRIMPTSSSWAEGIQFYMPNAYQWGGLRWSRARGNDDGNWYIGYVGIDGSDDMVFGANNSGARIDNILRLTKGGNVGIGTQNPQAKLEVAGNIVASGSVSAKYQDLAEWVPSSKSIQSGYVVIVDPGEPGHVLPSFEAYDTRVAGVISESPGIVLGESGSGKVKVATVGRVKVKVDATRNPILIGDLLVTSNNSGMAMKSEPVYVSGIKMHRPGTLIGKALEALSSGTGEITVLLSLQ